MTTSREQALKAINETQDFYVAELVKIITGINNKYSDLKEIDFTSPTGTGKTVMVAKLINKLPDYFFVVTSLSKGQLRFQIEDKLRSLVKSDNFLVYGSSEYTQNTILQEDDILKSLPNDKPIVWIRDEGHIATNRWQEVLRKRVSHIINFSATNKSSNGIQCNFSHTMMLRTVSQYGGTPEMALDKLLDVKEKHKNVKKYNPCALFRVLNDDNLERIITACESRGLSYINITDEYYDMHDICEDDNRYDVIINKFKITEGIDLKRCHVIYMDTKPGNDSTTIQVIGRARRNALFWRNDIDILDERNHQLLVETRRCFVFYNVPESIVEQNDFGEFTYSVCDTVSIEALKPNIEISVNCGQLPNGLHILELAGKTGTFKIDYDNSLNANVVNNPDFYKVKTKKYDNYIVSFVDRLSLREIRFKQGIDNCFLYNLRQSPKEYDESKIEFYVFKTVASSILSDETINYWEKRLETEKKYKLINSWVYGFEFAKDPNVLPILNEIRNNYKKYETLYKSPEALSYSKMVDEYGYLKSTVFILNGKLMLPFLKYIESIKYCDISMARKIETFLYSSNKVIQISANKYKVWPHPRADYFTDRFNTYKIRELKRIIKTSSKRSIGGTNIDYLKKMFSSINSIEEIDDYDARFLSLYELNIFFKIGLTDDEIQQYSTGNYDVIETDNPDDFLVDIYDLGEKNLVPKLVVKPTYINLSYIKEKFYVTYEAIINDKELATYGPDTMKYSSGRFTEDKKITTKIATFCKFNTFIEKRYQTYLEQMRPLYFSGENYFKFDKKCNSCLGFCVENYAKMKIYGDDDYKRYLEKARREAREDCYTDVVYVRAAMLIYKDEITKCYGLTNNSYIPSITVEQLVKDKYSDFVSTVVELGTKTKNFVLNALYNGFHSKEEKKYNPNLSVDHIIGVCDFITEDTILDVKCTSTIGEKYLKQVLAYHYLSTKRSDLKINRVIVFDAVTGKHIEVKLNQK